MSFTSNFPPHCEAKAGTYDDQREKICSFHFLCCSGVGQEPLSRTFRTFIGSTEKAGRPRKSRNFLKVTQPIKGRAGLEPRVPDSQARASHSPVLVSRFLQTKDFWNLPSPTPTPTPHAQPKGAAHKVRVPLAPQPSRLLTLPQDHPLRVRQALSPHPTFQGPDLSRQHKGLGHISA